MGIQSQRVVKTAPLINPNDSHEAYTGNHVGRKGNRTPLNQFRLVTYFKAVGQGVILSETNTKEPHGKVLEGLSGSKSVACVERNVGNLGGLRSSCLWVNRSGATSDPLRRSCPVKAPQKDQGQPADGDLEERSLAIAWGR